MSEALSFLLVTLVQMRVLNQIDKWEITDFSREDFNDISVKMQKGIHSISFSINLDVLYEMKYPCDFISSLVISNYEKLRKATGE